jgi:transposase-like protein
MFKLYPVDVIDFQDMFPTDDACFNYLCLIRWPDGFRCPHCQHDDAWRLGRGIFRCRQCHKDVSVTVGTIFQDTRKPLRLWFHAMWHVVCQKNGVSALGLQKMLGLGSYRTAWTWLHKLRTAMVRPGRDRLAGVVEVDETLIGGPKPGKRGRGAAGKTLVLVAVEDKGKAGIGRIRLRVIPNASEATLTAAVAELVEPGSTIRTDGWSGYNGLEAAGFVHDFVEHAEEAPGEDPTPLVHRIASLLKRWLLGTHQGGQQTSHLRFYLDEYTFRFNRRTSRSRGKLFYRLVQQALQVDPAPLSTLRAG